jgi:hypothetical protein
MTAIDGAWSAGRAVMARKVGVLAVLIGVAIVYAVFGDALRPFLADRFIGYFGIVLGLYIAAHPAANTVDVLFFDRSRLRDLYSHWSGLGWLLLNLVVLFAAWVVIVLGEGRLTSPMI